MLLQGQSKKIVFDDDGKAVETKQKHSKHDSAPQTFPQISADTTETSFPRGGVPIRTTRKRRSKPEGDTEDNDLFEDESEKKKPATKKRQKKEKKEQPRRSEKEKNVALLRGPLKYQDVGIGSLLLGVVERVTDERLVLGLPHGLRGSVSLSDVSSVYTTYLQRLLAGEIDDDNEEPCTLPDLYRVGQIIPCKVLGTEGKWFSLTTDPGKVQSHLTASQLSAGTVVSGVVESVEDTGYVVGILGSGRLRAFLPQRDKQLALRIGSHIRAVVDSVPNAVYGEVRSVTLSIASKQLRKPVGEGIPVLPGTPVQATISQVYASSLVTHCVGERLATINERHLRQPPLEYDKGQKLNCVVTYIHSHSGALALSNLPHLVAPSPTDRTDILVGIKPGEIHEASVTRVLKHAIYLKLSNHVKAVVQRGQWSDKPDMEPGDVCSVGKTLKCRVLRPMLADALAAASIKKSVLEQPFLNYHNVEPGAIVSAEIRAVKPDGLVVRVGGKLSAFIARLHLTDTGVSEALIGKRFKAGNTLTCRVLTIIPDEKRLSLTAKQSLVSESCNFPAKWQDLELNAIVTGFVALVQSAGILIAFAANVKGFAPKFELCLAEGQDVEKAFHEGQVVKCRVKRTDTRRDPPRMTLSLQLDPEAAERERREKLREAKEEKRKERNAKRNEKDEGKKKQKNVYKVDERIGQVMSCVVERIDAEEKTVSVLLEPGQLCASLPFQHLLDDVALVDDYVPTLKTGQTIDKVVVIKVEGENLVVSAKPSYVRAAEAKELAQTPSELQVDSLVVASVLSLKTHSILIHLCGDLTARVRLKFHGEKTNKKAEKVCKPGQTVLVRIVSVSEDQIVHANMDLRNIYGLRTPGGGEAADADRPLLSVAIMLDHIEASQRCNTVFQPHTDAERELASLRPGQLCDVTVKGLSEHGALCALPGGASGFCIKENYPFAEIRVGLQLQMVGLDVDLPGSKTVELSANNWLVRGPCQRSEMRVGLKLQMVVLDVDLLGSKTVELSANNWLVKARQARLSSKQTKEVEAGLNVQSRVVHIKPAYALIVLKGNVMGALAYVPTRHVWQDQQGMAKFVPGQDNKVVVMNAPGSLDDVAVAMLKIYEKLAFQNEVPLPTHELKLNEVITARIESVDGHKVWLSVPNSEVKALAHLTQITEIKDNVAVDVKVGDSVDARVTGFLLPTGDKSHDYRYVNAESFKRRRCIPEVSLKPSVVKCKKGKDIENEHQPPPVDSQVTAIFERYAAPFLWFSLTPRLQGRMRNIYAADDVQVCNDPEKYFKVNHIYNVKVLGRQIKNFVDIAYIDMDTVADDAVVRGVVSTVLGGQGLSVMLPNGNRGRVQMTDVCDVYSDDALKAYKDGDVCRCFVLDASQPHMPFLSLRASRTGKSAPPRSCDVEILHSSQLTPGRVLRGYVVKPDAPNNTSTITIGHDLVGSATVPDSESLQTGQVVTVTVASVEESDVKLTLTTDKKATPRKAQKQDEGALEKLRSLKMEQKQSGKRKRGISESSQNSERQRKKDIQSEATRHLLGMNTLKALSFSVGDNIKGLEGNVDDVEPMEEDDESCPTTDEGTEPTVNVAPSVSEPKAKKKKKKGKMAEEQETPPVSKKMEKEEETVDENEVTPKKKKKKDKREQEKTPTSNKMENEEDKTDEDEVTPKKKKRKENSKSDTSLNEDKEPSSAVTKQKGTTKHKENTNVQRLQVSDGFCWDDDFHLPGTEKTESRDHERDDLSDDSWSSEDEGDMEVEANAHKKPAVSKSEQRRLEEKEVYKRERALLSGDFEPQTAVDFERLLATERNSSMLWLRFMAHELAEGDTDRARLVAERAINTIDFREEQERLNVWVALLNLEHTHGSPETLHEVFTRALQHNDPLKIYRHLIAIYNAAQNTQAAEELHGTVVKKFGSTQCDVWFEYARFLVDSSRLDAARKLLKRALQALPVQQHADLLSGFAQVEFSAGEVTQGIALMDNLLVAHPRRTDIWNVYCDQLIKADKIDAARRLYERQKGLKLPNKKMASVFKRWLAFEERHGTEERVLQVRKAALQYVQKEVTC